SNDIIFENLWEKLLPIQAHDCYVVPHIRSGYYLQTQLDNEELRKIELTKNPNSISELSIQIHKEIQEKCTNQINTLLLELVTEILKDQVNMDEKPNTIIVFNPTPYSRRDIVSIQMNQENSLRKIIAEIPGFGYKVYPISEDHDQRPKVKSNFLYHIKISDDLMKIEVKYKNKLVYELSFLLLIPYELELINNYSTNVEDIYVIRGNANNQSFTINIFQFSGINRLEFVLKTNSKNHVILTPKVNIQKPLINYPFGIEETRRSQIQTLDFIWLEGRNEQIIYIQKNSQRFEINQENFELKNILFNGGRYEFAIVITDKKDSLSVLEYVYSYYYKLLGLAIDTKREIYEEKKCFLSINPPLPIVSLWRWKEGIYLRTFNPTNEEIEVNFDGILVGKQLKEVDLLLNEIASINSNKTKITPWKIKTFKLK
ncbi:MAG: glycosyl hydrolase-related protein, partial [Promethearchaeota archaeon]